MKFFKLQNAFLLLTAIWIIALLSCGTTTTEEVVEASYPDGSPKTVRYYLDDGKSRVLVKEVQYYANHQKYLEGEFENGERTGKWTSWFDNGNKWSEGNFKKGLDSGKRQVWFENGKLFYEGQYKDGEKTGEWKFYDEQGNFVRSEDYTVAK